MFDTNNMAVFREADKQLEAKGFSPRFMDTAAALEKKANNAWKKADPETGDFPEQDFDRDAAELVLEAQAKIRTLSRW